MSQPWSSRHVAERPAHPGVCVVVVGVFLVGGIVAVPRRQLAKLRDHPARTSVTTAARDQIHPANLGIVDVRRDEWPAIVRLRELCKRFVCRGRKLAV